MIRIGSNNTLFFLFLYFIVQAAHAIEILEWKKKPLKVSLTVDHERVIFFDNDIKIGVTQSTASVMRIQSNAGTIYLKANSEFKPKRLQVKDLVTGRTIILDVSASKSKKYPLTEDIKVVGSLWVSRR